MILKRRNDNTLWENNDGFIKILGDGFDGSPVMELDKVDGDGYFTYIHECDLENGEYKIIDDTKMKSKYVLLYICEVDKNSYTTDRIKLLDYYREHKQEIDIWLFDNYSWLSNRVKGRYEGGES